MDEQTVQTGNIDNPNIPYLRRHSLEVPNDAIWRKHLSRGMEPSRASKNGFKQCVLFSLAMVCGFIFLVGWDRTPFAPVFQYEERLASIIRTDVAMMKLEAELPMKREVLMPSGCDYTKGRWVRDELGPLYSGKECTGWLTDVWACRLSNRTDFEYENYRWQPDDCDLPSFNGDIFLRRMQNKIIAFAGDSK